MSCTLIYRDGQVGSLHNQRGSGLELNFLFIYLPMYYINFKMTIGDTGLQLVLQQGKSDPGLQLVLQEAKSDTGLQLVLQEGKSYTGLRS